MRSISSCLSTELRSNGRGSSLSLEDLETKEISVHKSTIETDKIKENLNISDRNATVTSLALSRNQQLFVSICRFKHEMSSYLSFCAKSEMVVAVPVYSKDGKKIKIFILVTVELSRRIKNHLRSIRFLSNNLRTHEREKLHKDTHFYNTRRLYFLKIKHTWINSLNKGGIVYITTHGIFKFLAKELLKKKKKQTNDALLIYCLIHLQIKLSVTHVTS